MCDSQVSYGDEKFPPNDQGVNEATPTGELLAKAKHIAQVSHCRLKSNRPPDIFAYYS